MNKPRFAWSLLLGACLLLTACQDRRDPVKPTVAQSTADQPAA
ncbi:hypothetical protein [Massilia sp. TN1-12]